MTQNPLRKQIILGAVLVGAFAMTDMGSADARPWAGNPGWRPACDDCVAGNGYQARLPDQKTIAARDKFLSETVATRKEIAVKRAEQEALMNSDTPDAKRIAQLAGEIFDLREQLLAKASENGVRGIGYGPEPETGPEGPPQGQ